MRGEKRLRLFKNAIFFLNVLVAILIIISSRFLVRTDFGKAALSFGLVMVAISTLLKMVQKW